MRSLGLSHHELFLPTSHDAGPDGGAAGVDPRRPLISLVTGISSTTNPVPAVRVSVQTQVLLLGALVGSWLLVFAGLTFYVYGHAKSTGLVVVLRGCRRNAGGGLALGGGNMGAGAAAAQYYEMNVAK